MSNRVLPTLKWHGGKYYLAQRIVALMPAHTHYCEPYAGGLSVLLAKDPEGVSECINDVHKDLMRFWKVLQSEQSFHKFRRLCEATPFSEAEWLDADLEMQEWPEPCAEASEEVVRAWRLFVWCRLSLAGRMKSFTGITKTRTRRGMNNEVSAWLTCIEGLPLVHARLKRVLILNRPALEVIAGQDSPQTLTYCDPPYIKSTRASPEVYAHEMSESQHTDLLEVLKSAVGKVMLSGYRNGLYDTFLSDWNRHDFEIPNQAAGGKAKRVMTESLWCNF